MTGNHNERRSNEIIVEICDFFKDKFNDNFLESLNKEDEIKIKYKIMWCIFKKKLV